MSHVAVLRAILLYSCEIVACDVVAMEKEQAFEIVSKIVFDRACQLIVGGNPAYESETVLFQKLVSVCLTDESETRAGLRRASTLWHSRHTSHTNAPGLRGRRDL